ncbi:MAG: class I adenylate-forming enzyme family protein [Actinomycetota bacterium]|nr:class I adenylate-forming enzyme family protein [Actinomycetota bacterium]
MSPVARPLNEVCAQLTSPGQPYETEVVDVRGVSFTSWKHAPANLVEILEQSSRFGSREFIVHEGQRVTYAEHYAQAATMARRLIEHGVTPGDRVALAARNLPQGIVTFWGALAAGAVIAPLNAWWTSEELAYGLNDSEATILVLDEERLARLRKQFNHLEHLRHIVVISDDPAHGADLGKPHDIISLHGYGDFLGSVDPRSTLPPVNLGPDDDATVFYTAGTTSKPKGAVATHRNSVVSVMSLGFANECRDLAAGVDHHGAREITLLNIPLFHVTGALAGLVANTATGGTLLTMRHFDAGRALALIERERATTIGGVPTIVQQLLAHPDFTKFDLSSVRSVAYGGAPVPENLPARIRGALPRAIASNGYGLTETSALVAQISGQQYLDHPTSCGLAVPVCEIAIVPESFDGTEPTVECRCASNEAGELWVKGPHVVRGYWHKPQATSQCFSHGWVRTGDIARIDEEGLLYIVDRSKDMIIHRGENVYPSVVEAEILEHPAVAECAVIGLPDEDDGEEVVAVIVLREAGLIDMADIAAFVRPRVASFEMPSRFYLRPFALPRNAQLKVLKRELREALAHESF